MRTTASSVGWRSTEMSEFAISVMTVQSTDASIDWRAVVP